MNRPEPMFATDDQLARRLAQVESELRHLEARLDQPKVREFLGDRLGEFQKRTGRTRSLRLL